MAIRRALVQEGNVIGIKSSASSTDCMHMTTYKCKYHGKNKYLPSITNDVNERLS